MRISVTYEGLTSEFDVGIDGEVSDADVRQIGAELLLAKQRRAAMAAVENAALRSHMGMPLPGDVDLLEPREDGTDEEPLVTPRTAIDLSDHVVDRDTASNAIYLRPAVPFG